MVYAFGVQYQVTDKLPVRFGYSFNENPIADGLTCFNIAANAVVVSRISGGFSYDVSEKLTGSLGFQYGFENSIEGPWIHPQFGAVEGTSIESSLQTVFVMFGLDYRFN